MSRRYSDEVMRERAEAFYAEVRARRSVRRFSDEPVPREVIVECLRAANTAPSGANMQPWHFVAVSDPEVKRRIRQEAEAVERAFYEERAPREWKEALVPLGTDANKPFLEEAPWLIVVFAQKHGTTPRGERVRHYYVQESVGLATGLLVTALHHAGLGVLTYTPSPMGFLTELLDRPPNERPYLVLVVGHRAPGATPPDVERKAPDEVTTWFE
jgi:nitroreductase